MYNVIFRILALVILISYNSYAICQERLNLNTSESTSGDYSMNPSDIYRIDKLNKFFNATVKLEFSEKTCYWCKKFNSSCMGILVHPNLIYTATHCIYNTNIVDLKQMILTVIDPKTGKVYKNIDMENIKTRNIKFNQTKEDFLTSSPLDKLSNELIILEVPEKDAKSFSNVAVKNPTLIKSASQFTKLVTCDPAFTEGKNLSHIISPSCKESPTITIALASPGNGGWFRKKQNSNKIQDHEDKLNGAFQAYSSSFGVYDSYIIPDSSKESLLKHLQKHDYINSDGTPLMAGIYGIFDFYSDEKNKNPFYYETTGSKTISLKHIDIDYNSKAEYGDSGSPVVSCDQSGVLSTQKECYLMGVVQGVDWGVESPIIGTTIPLLDIGTNFIDKN